MDLVSNKTFKKWTWFQIIKMVLKKWTWFQKNVFKKMDLVSKKTLIYDR